MPVASKHACYMDTGCVISINVGMKVEAVRGKNWSYHRGKLLGIFVAALKQSPDIIGMLVSEVGNADHSYGAEEREMFNELFRDAFRKADGGRSASEHNDIQIFWARGDAAETVMVFRPYVDVEMLGTIYPLRDWRRVEVARPPARTE